MKIRSILKGFCIAIVIIFLLSAIGVSGYFLYQFSVKRQQIPEEVLLTEQEKTQIAYEENLSYGPVPLGRDQGQEFYWRKKAAETGDKESIEKFNLYFPENKTY